MSATSILRLRPKRSYAEGFTTKFTVNQSNDKKLFENSSCTIIFTFSQDCLYLVSPSITGQDIIPQYQKQRSPIQFCQLDVLRHKEIPTKSYFLSGNSQKTSQ
ncbi:hypothetical protein [Nostoc sp.]|uniref:hypothetical protein n=1 Tax=Nostoc sp. TaxID=1180 RepID=UPI002FFA4EB3